MPKLLTDEILQQVKGVFDAQLNQPVEVLFFGTKNEENCTYCADTRQLVEEVVAISDTLHLSAYDLEENAQTPQTYHVDKTPTLVIAARGGEDTPDGDALIDYGVRYVGLPSGH